MQVQPRRKPYVLWVMALALVVAILLWFITAVVFVWKAFAQQGSCPFAVTPIDGETLTVSSTAVGLTPAKAGAADAVYLTMEGATPLRFLMYGGVPTSTTGHLYDPPSSGGASTGSGTWICSRKAVLNLQMIRASNADVVLRVTYYRKE